MTLNTLPKLVINLESRPDRLAQVKKDLHPYSAFVMPGIVDKDPMTGIAMAHLNCIRLAKEKRWDQVIIMEDDVCFRLGAWDYLRDALQAAPQDWEILLSGVYEENGIEQVNGFWDKIGEFCGLHFYIVHSRAYNKILTYDGRLHIDRWMNHRGTRLKAYQTRRYATYQRDGYSDNSRSHTNYNDLHLKKKKLL